MDNRQNPFRNPQKQLILFVLACVIVFFILIRIQGSAPANDMAVNNAVIDQYAYTAYGKAGVGVFFIPNGKDLIFRRFLQTPGEANDLQVRDGIAYLADGKGGLRIYDLNLPETPREIANYKPEAVRRGWLNLEDRGAAESVFVAGKYAYLSYGDLGLVVVDVANPEAPVGLARFDAHAPVKAAIVADNTAFLAAGRAGIIVADTSLPRAMDTLAVLDTPGTASDLALYTSDDGTRFILVADGPAGVQVISLEDLQHPKKVSTVPQTGLARHIQVRGERAYVTLDPGGTLVFDLKNLPDMLKIDQSPPVEHVLQTVLHGRYLYLLDSEGGITILDQNSARGIIELGRLAYPGKPGAGQFGLILFLVLAGSFLWGGVFSQFVLPVRNLNERWEAFRHFVLYVFGGHGDMTMVMNGTEVKRSGSSGVESGRRRILPELLKTLTWPFSSLFIMMIDRIFELGSGVMILDPASAGMLRTPAAYTRPVGPGVVFTKKGEYLAQALDIRRKRHVLGPFPGEDPFAPKGDNESPEDYHRRQARRRETNAFTKDGIEIVPNLTIVFRLNAAPGRGGTPYGYNPTSVRRAAMNRNVETTVWKTGEMPHDAWSRIPGTLAVDLLREYASKYMLEQLFEARFSSTDGRRISGWQMIVEGIRERLKRPVLTAAGTDGTPTVHQIVSPEYRMLQERGLVVVSFSLDNLRIDNSIEDVLTDRWQKQQGRNLERKYGDLNNRPSEVSGKREALFDFVKWSASALANRLDGSSENDTGLDGTASLLLEGIRDGCMAQNEEERSELRTRSNEIDDILEYVLSR